MPKRRLLWYLFPSYALLILAAVLAIGWMALVLVENSYLASARTDMRARANFLAGGLPIGERKKLEVARVLATQPKLLLLDEVMGGLNPAESEEIIQLILDIRKLGVTQMVIEHDMKAIMRISDRIVVLNSGEKLAEGGA